MPLVSIIIACLNDRKHLPRAVESVLGQSFLDIEIIIMDGASNDGTVDYLRSLDDPRIIWHSERDGGIAQAWNRAIGLARSDWLLFLGADDYIWDMDVIANAAPCLTAGPNVLFAFGEVWVVAENDDRVVQKIKFDKPALLAQLRGPNGLGLPHQGFFHRRDAFEDGPFDTSFRLAADYEFITRFSAPRNFLFLPIGPIAAFRMGGLSTNPWGSVEAYREFARVHRLRGRSAVPAAWQLTKAHTKMILKRLFGASIAQCLVNISRAMRNLPPYSG